MTYSVQPKKELQKFNIYLLDSNKKLSKFEVCQVDYEEAIIDVKQHLIREGEGWDGAIVACLEGGKNAN